MIHDLHKTSLSQPAINQYLHDQLTYRGRVLSQKLEAAEQVKYFTAYYL